MTLIARLLQLSRFIGIESSHLCISDETKAAYILDIFKVPGLRDLAGLIQSVQMYFFLSLQPDEFGCFLSSFFHSCELQKF
jgi:hypothetical protein